MDKILLIGCSGEKKNRLVQILDGYFKIDYCIDEGAALSVFSNPNHDIVLVLLSIDTIQGDGLDFLSVMSTRPDLIHIPVVIMTEDPFSPDLTEYINRGAYDFINFQLDSLLIVHKIRNIVLASKNKSPNLEKMNAYMFHHCLGAAILMELYHDKLSALMINDEFYQLLGFDSAEYNQYKSNLMETVLPNEVEIVNNTIQTALTKGTAQCVMSNLETNRSFQVNYHRISVINNRAIFLITIDDITKNIHSKEISDTMLNLPGLIFFDYDVQSNITHFYIKSDDENRELTIYKNGLDENNRSWISPDSYNLYERTFEKAKIKPTSGSIEILAKLSHKADSWHRMYYRSIANRNGQIYRIVGRLDDLERNVWSGSMGGHQGVCDIESNLLTYQAVSGFMNQAVSHKKEGILLLLDIEGLNEICEIMSIFEKQISIRHLVHQLKKLFMSTDIMGRFGQEGFVVFMPETSSSNVAKKKAAAMIKTVVRNMPDKKYKCNIGISIVNPTCESASSVISDANIALLESKRKGDREYVIFTDY